MYLYHGTNFGALENIMKEGLLPRMDTGGSNRWGEFPSREDCIYLSRLYAPYFALNKTEVGEKWLLIRIKKEALIQDLLLPDEDYVAGILPKDMDNMSLAEKTEFARRLLPNLIDRTDDSIRMLGNCAYRSHVNLKQIDKIVAFDLKQNPLMNIAIDPTITVMNALMMGGKYTALTEWFFEEPTEEGLSKIMFAGPTEPSEKAFDEAWNRTKDLWFSRKGLETIYTAEKAA